MLNLMACLPALESGSRLRWGKTSKLESIGAVPAISLLATTEMSAFARIISWFTCILMSWRRIDSGLANKLQMALSDNDLKAMTLLPAMPHPANKGRMAHGS